MMTRLTNKLVQGAPVLVLLLAWELYVRSGLVSPALLPAPSTVATALWEQIFQPRYHAHVERTLVRMLGGLAIGLVVGATLGLLCAVLPRLSAVTQSLVQVLAPLPKIAFYPALLLVLGFDDAPKIVLVAIDTMFPIFFATYFGAISIDQKFIWSARAAGMSTPRIVMKIMLPAASPSVIASLKVGLVISAIVVFSSEMMSSSDGLGHLLVMGARSYRMIEMFTAVAAIAILSSTMSGLITWSSRRWLSRFT